MVLAESIESADQPYWPALIRLLGKKNANHNVYHSRFCMCVLHVSGALSLSHLHLYFVSHLFVLRSSLVTTHALYIRAFCKMHKRFVSLIDFGFQCNICAGAKWMFLTHESAVESEIEQEKKMCVHIHTTQQQQQHQNAANASSTKKKERTTTLEAWLVDYCTIGILYVETRFACL